MEGVIGVVTCFAADFSPKYWATCDGQLLPISQNQALFSILGTTYGGNGIQTFALPDMRGRTAVSQGNGAGLPAYNLGQQGGSETTTLILNNLPSHVHNGPVNVSLKGDNTTATNAEPDYNYPAPVTNAYGTTANGTMLPPAYTCTIGVAGTNVPVNVRSPYLVLNYVICLFGIFPSRN